MIQILISEEYVGQRIDKALPVLLPQYTRSKVQSLIENKRILVNDTVVKSSYKLDLEDEVTINVEEVDLSIKPENIPLDIRYEDDDVVVINKEQGMVVHPANGHYEGTLVNALLYHFDNLSNGSNSARPGIVHRIDKDTSGLLMVAKNDEAHEFLSAQLKDKTAYRRYIALVKGEIPHNEGEIRAPIGRSNANRKEMAVVSEGKSAVTHFKVIERLHGYTLIECILETGRTHQIRVHMKYIKYPIVGDPMYGTKNTHGLNGQLLHAATLSFIHPKTNERVTVEAPLPEYFENVLSNLRKNGEIEG